MPHLLIDSTLTGSRHNLISQPSSAPSQGALLFAGAPTGRRVVVETYERANTTGGLGTTDSGHVYKQSSPNFMVNGGAAVKATGSASIRYYTFVETGITGDWVLDWEFTTSPTTNTTDGGFVIGGVDSTATQGGQVYVSFRKTSTANSVRILHRADTSGADTALLTNASAGWADATTYTGQIIRSGNTIEITRGGVTIAGPYTVTGTALTALNSGTHQGPTVTNTDAGSRFESWSVFDPAAVDTPPASPTPTGVRVIAHRATLASAGASTENSVAGLNAITAGCRRPPNGTEGDVRVSADNELFMMHDTTGARTHPAMGSLGVEDCTAAQLDTYGVTRLTAFLAAWPGRGMERCNLQHYFPGSNTAAMTKFLQQINASPIPHRVKIMTSITGPWAPAQIRAAGWTGPIGTYGSTAANYAGSGDGKAADFPAYSIGWAYLPPGGYSANRGHVATLQGAAILVGASTENSSSTWAAAHADAIDEVLVDQADQWLALYEPPPADYSTTVLGKPVTLATSAPTGTVTALTAVNGPATTLTTTAPAGTVSAAATVIGPVCVATTTTPAGAVTTAANAAGPAATSSSTAPAGTVTAAAAVNGVPSGVTTTAPAGTVTALRAAIVAGPVSTLSISTTAGAVTALRAADVPGVPAAAALEAPAGAVTSLRTAVVTGPATTSTVTAPAGGVAAGGSTSVPGVPATLSLIAVSGTVTALRAASIGGVPATVAVTTPAGAVTAGTTSVVTGPTVTLTTAAPAGAVAASKAAQVAGVAASITTTAPPGLVTVAAGATVPGAVATLLLTAPAGQVDDGSIPSQNVDPPVAARLRYRVTARTRTRVEAHL